MKKDPGSRRFLDAPTVKDQCENCGSLLMVGEWPWCPHGRPGGHHHMIPYTVEIDGKSITISSMQQASSIERDTMQKYRNGEGQPLVFRTFHQDSSNKDRNTLASMGVQQYDTNKPIHPDRLPPKFKRDKFKE